MNTRRLLMETFLRQFVSCGCLFLMAALLTGCTPRVEIAGSDKPITINMNVKIDHEVRVKVEKDLDKVISKDSELF